MDTALFAKLVRPIGDDLPYPDPSPREQSIIVAALQHAWQSVCAQHGSALQDMTEDQTTALLEQALLALLDDESVEGFVVEFFSVARECKVVNFDGNHPDKMPDLAFSLRRRPPGLPPDYALHVECKPVNRTVGMTPYYGRHGMGRFIHGDYGVKMRSGLMLAYAESGYTFANKIAPRLCKRLGQPDDPMATTSIPTAQPHGVPETSHRRAWRYADGRAPGDIRLLHIWLPLP